MDIFSALLWLTLNIYHEARGEDQIAQIAVGHVTLNRAKRTDSMVKTEVLKPYQFSWVHTMPWEPREAEALLQSFQSAIIAYNGFDFTGGSTHYHTKKVKPYWSKKMSLVMQVGNHKFYKERKLIKTLNVKRCFRVKSSGTDLLRNGNISHIKTKACGQRSKKWTYTK